ncbi:MULTISPECIES: hypothetical protein [Micromonospora]|uniref:hypothetical protein n=1 Tax=Micromonospora TaxID=1873 RepID=UPI0021CAE2F1|nr:hypothetical protein [Micromonospora sp. Mcm103]
MRPAATVLALNGRPRRAGGNYTASYQAPRLAATTGTVSIRARAEDAAGNTVEQTVLDAFRLTAR